MTIDQKAKTFALNRHGNQDHGSLKIKDHLSDVVKNVRIHFHDRDLDGNRLTLAETEAAAWMHDVLEDTKTTYNEILENFGPEIAAVVAALTDAEGSNRIERHLHTYYRIRESSTATLIKLCDRRHNHERSIKYGEHWMAMYLKEYNYFKFALWQPNMYEALWAELDDQYQEMNNKMSW